MDGSGSRAVPSLQIMLELRDKPGARAYWVQVPGAAQAPLSDARLAALMNWLVERFAGQPPKPAYTAKEVGELRSTPLRDPIGRRQQMTHRHTPLTLALTAGSGHRGCPRLVTTLR